jgi:hypothetical protein
MIHRSLIARNVQPIQIRIEAIHKTGPEDVAIFGCLRAILYFPLFENASQAPCRFSRTDREGQRNSFRSRQDRGTCANPSLSVIIFADVVPTRMSSMRISVTGATGFLGRYIVQRLSASGHHCRCWHRARSDRGGFEVPAERLAWPPGQLGDAAAAARLVSGCDAVVNAGLYRVGADFRGGDALLDKTIQQILGEV